MRHLNSFAAIGWSSTGDTVNQQVHVLSTPLRNVVPGFSRPTYRAESLDRTVIEALTVGSGAHELVGEVRYDDNPESLVEMLRAGAQNITLNYYPDARDATQVIPCKLITPVGPQIDAVLDAQRGSFGDGAVTIRLRRTDQHPFNVTYHGRDVLWWYRGGGSLRGYTFSRADTATTYGADGQVLSAASGLARTIWPPSGNFPNQAIAQPALLLEGASTNLVLQSENFGTTWTAQGTPTRSAAAKTCGTVVLDLLGDDDGAALEYYHQNITFTGNAVKCVSVFWHPGTSIAAGGAAVVLRDTSAGADRLSATIQSDGSNGYPSVTASTGSLIDAWELANGVWRIAFLTSSVTAANTNNLRIQPVAVAAQTGNAYFGGIQAEDATVPSSYMPTTTATNTRVTDSLTRTVAFEARADSAAAALVTTVYVRFVEAGSYRVANNRIWQLSGANPLLYVEGSGSFYRAVLSDNLGATATATLAAAPSYGAVVELLVTADPSVGTVTISQSIGGAAATSANASLGVGRMPPVWGNNTFYLNAGPSGNQGWLWLLNGAIVRGSRALDAMRRIARV